MMALHHGVSMEAEKITTANERKEVIAQLPLTAATPLTALGDSLRGSVRSSRNTTHAPPHTHDTTRHDTTRHDTTRHDTTRHDTTRHDTTRHDTTRTAKVVGTGR
jgi:hypothetical protein